MTQNGDFSKGSIIKIFMRLAIPMTLAQLMNVLYNVVDRMFIGRIGGDSMDALTGVGVCLPMITIVIAFAIPSYLVRFPVDDTFFKFVATS